jgi:peptide-methionine (S)-S-oxide reductase
MYRSAYAPYPSTRNRLGTLGLWLALASTTLLGCSPTGDSPAPNSTGAAVPRDASGATAQSLTETRPVADIAGPQTARDEEDSNVAQELETITLGAGCFWCIEAVLLRIKGVESVVSGYMGGQIVNPTYEQVCTGRTGHAEVVQVRFDPEVMPLDQLLDVFWQLHDPTTLNRQGFDVGTQYRSAIFYHDAEQKEAAQKSKDKWNESGKFRDPIVTEITAASEFYKAEAYHQDYFAKNPRNPYCRANILPKFKKLGLLKPSDK